MYDQELFIPRSAVKGHLYIVVYGTWLVYVTGSSATTSISQNLLNWVHFVLVIPIHISYMNERKDSYFSNIKVAQI